MTALPLDAAGRRPAFFEQDGMDQMLSMLLELAAELWVVRERLFMVEGVLGQQGVPVREAVERYVPSEQERAELAKMRADLTAQMFRTLGREHREIT